MREYIIDEKFNGTKYFSFLKKMVGEQIKNSDLFKLIRKGVVRVNDKKMDFSYSLQEGDVVTFYLAENYFREKKKAHFPVYPLNIVYEDEDLLVVNKERGVLVHSDGNEFRHNLVEYVKGYLYRKGEYTLDSLFAPTFCNRLDFNTSGIVVAAKNQPALKAVTGLFRKRLVDKRYYTLVYGCIRKEFLIISKILERADQKNKMKCSGTQALFQIPKKELFLKQNPELSATLIKPVLQSENCSLVRVELWTGKKHQIRAHLSSAGYPLIGDLKYFHADSAMFAKRNCFDGYYLHSYFLNLGLAKYGAWQVKPAEDFLNKIKILFPKKENYALFDFYEEI